MTLFKFTMPFPPWFLTPTAYNSISSSTLRLVFVLLLSFGRDMSMPVAFVYLISKRVSALWHCVAARRLFSCDKYLEKSFSAYNPILFFLELEYNTIHYDTPFIEGFLTLWLGWDVIFLLLSYLYFLRHPFGHQRPCHDVGDRLWHFSFTLLPYSIFTHIHAALSYIVELSKTPTVMDWPFWICFFATIIVLYEARSR